MYFFLKICLSLKCLKCRIMNFWIVLIYKGINNLLGFLILFKKMYFKSKINLILSWFGIWIYFWKFEWLFIIKLLVKLRVFFIVIFDIILRNIDF